MLALLAFIATVFIAFTYLAPRFTNNGAGLDASRPTQSLGASAVYPFVLLGLHMLTSYNAIIEALTRDGSPTGMMAGVLLSFLLFTLALLLTSKLVNYFSPDLFKVNNLASAFVAVSCLLLLVIPLGKMLTRLGLQ